VTVALDDGRRRWGTLLWPGVSALVMLAVLIGLGVWQLERKVWKEALIDTLNKRVAAEPIVLPAPSAWQQLDPQRDEFRRVMFTATVAPARAALVFTSGSSLRPDVSGLGYWVFAPARPTGGGTVVVNLGFVPEGSQHSTLPAAGPPVTMIGTLRWPEQRSWFAPADDPARNLWFVRDHRAIAAANGWGEVAPFFVDLESAQPAGGLPRPGPLQIRLRNDHLQYAITWFALAGVLVVIFAVWARGRVVAQPAPGQRL
jgi:cytochrome oxidase assembly protein ShyY1